MRTMLPHIDLIYSARYDRYEMTYTKHSEFKIKFLRIFNFWNNTFIWYSADCFNSTSKYMLTFFHHSLTLKRRRLIKFTRSDEKISHTARRWYEVCWQLGDVSQQGISSRGIDLVGPNFVSLSTRRSEFMLRINPLCIGVQCAKWLITTPHYNTLPILRNTSWHWYKIVLN